MLDHDDDDYTCRDWLPQDPTWSALVAPQSSSPVHLTNPLYIVDNHYGNSPSSLQSVLPCILILRDLNYNEMKAEVLPVRYLRIPILVDELPGGSGPTCSGSSTLQEIDRG